MEESKNLRGVLGKSPLEAALKVITNPWEFYREMPKTGGYLIPIRFFVAMILIAIIINTSIDAALHILGDRPFMASEMFASMGIGLILGILIAPVFSFVMAGILFVIWKLMGSQESYETAYRCTAFSYGIAPVTSVIFFIPYIGPIVSMAWGFYILIIMSIEAHKIKSSLAWTVWGIIAIIASLLFIILFIILSLSAR